MSCFVKGKRCQSLHQSVFAIRVPFQGEMVCCEKSQGMGIERKKSQTHLVKTSFFQKGEKVMSRDICVVSFFVVVK